MAKHLILGTALIFFVGCQTEYLDKNGSNRLNLKTVEDVWNKHPERLRHLLAATNQSETGIEEYLVKGDTLKAAQKLLAYFRTVQRNWVITTLDSMADPLRTSDRLLDDSLELAGQLAKIPSTATGGWQWNYTGPTSDDEFGYSLNGHKYLTSLYFAQLKKPKLTLIQKFDEIIVDWVVNHPLPPLDDSIYVVLDTTQSIDWRDIGEVEWRTLEAGNRLGASWPALFFAFQQSPEFSDAARLLMLSSMVDQANYLRHFHKSKHNWTTMEMNGLALVSLAFPEFRQAQEWASYALRVMDEEINRQVYPDGIQTEISTKTQWVALSRFESVAANFEKAGGSISPMYMDQIQQMYHYLAYCMRPDGHQPLNNDSDREDLRSRVLKAAQKFNRPDWTWVATNGTEGVIPKAGPSLVFPWGGMQIMRNNWRKEAHWAFFDMGPYGTGHQHRDKLHLSITAFSKDFLVDGGRYIHQDYFSFDPANWRGYFRSSYSHNVILIDGHGQKAGAVRTSQPLVEDINYSHQVSYDYACSVFDDGFETLEGQVTHRRSILYLKDRFWLVVDHIDTDRLRDIQVLWHFHPDHKVILNEAITATDNPDGPNLEIVPTGDISWSAEVVQGRETPTKQGWYSADYGTKVPNPTAVYSSQISGQTTFAWLIFPAKDLIPSVSIRSDDQPNTFRIQVKTDDNNVVVVEMPKDCNAKKVKISDQKEFLHISIDRLTTQRDQSIVKAHELADLNMKKVIIRHFESKMRHSSF